jgi:hypothetical protein
MVRNDPDLARALRRHKSVIEHFYYYRAFTDAVKGRAIGPALQLLLRNTGSFRHILSESAMQAPRVTLKALRGGYRNGFPRLTAVGHTRTAHHPGRQT